MRKSILMAAAFVLVTAFSACSLSKQNVAKPEVSIDYGTSEIYSEEDMASAIEEIKEEFGTWEGCELHSMTYAGDECMNDENIRWMNELKEGEDFTQCIEFLSNFHSPKKPRGAWQEDTEYENWNWWLARSEGGDWELLTWGY